MLTADAPDLLRLVGYLTGSTLYAMLLAMVVRARQPDRLMIAAAVCGLAWNIGELLVEVLRRLPWGHADVWLEAVSYSALGALAAVVIHSVTHDPNGSTTARHRVQQVLRIAAYVVALTAGGLHLTAAAWGGLVPSRTGLVLLTTGLVVLAPALLLTTGGQAHGRRALWMTALTLVAVSALHLESPHRPDEWWVLELVGHHASIPLAFAILYEDYRFALADLFLKRALTLIVLVSAVFMAWSAIMPSGVPLTSDVKGALLALWIATALLFPLLQHSVTAFVDRFVLRRANYVTLVEDCSTLWQDADTEDVLLDRVCTLLAPALSASSVTWEPRPVSGPFAVTSHEVAIATAEVPQYVLIVGPLAGGRRLLSDDSAMLERLAIQIARRIDALRLTDERYARVMLESQMQALATEAELRALRAQINPHFLFNALTTIGYLIQQAPPRALDTLMRLTTLLRGVLRSEGEFTTLGHERELIECYLRIERERFEERLQVHLDIPDTLHHLPIPALIVQPLVENAIKHGVAPVREGGAVVVAARLLRRLPGGLQLSITVRNTGAPMHGRTSTGGGVGLHNVERRLACYYGSQASLELRPDVTGATVAELRLPMSDSVDQSMTIREYPTSA